MTDEFDEVCEDLGDGPWIACENEDCIWVSTANEHDARGLYHDLRECEVNGGDMHKPPLADDDNICCGTNMCHEQVCEYCLMCDDSDDACCSCNLPRCMCCEQLLQNRVGDDLVPWNQDYSTDACCLDCEELSREQQDIFRDILYWEG